MRRLVALPGLVAGLVASAVLALGKQPADDRIWLLLIPSPAECRVEPRAPAYSEAAAATPISSASIEAESMVGAAPSGVTGIPEATPTVGVATLDGRAVDNLTWAVVEATVREFVACVNAGDAARAAALLTDRFAREVGLAPGFGGLGPGVPPATAAPLPRTERGVAFAVIDVERRGDVLVAQVELAWQVGLDPERQALELVMVFERGRYRIDGGRAVARQELGQGPWLEPPLSPVEATIIASGYLDPLPITLEATPQSS